MSLTFNGAQVKKVTLNGDDVKRINYNDTEVWTGIPTVLNDATWEQIAEVAKAGKGADYWDVGDRKEVTLNGTVSSRTLSNYKWYCYILGFNHNAAIESNNTIHFQFGFNALSGGTHVAMTDSYYHSYSDRGTGFCMNISEHNSGGWELSHMHKDIIPMFRNCLPSDLKSVLKTIDKYTNNSGIYEGTSYISKTRDDIFLLAEYELYGSRMYADKYEYTKQEQYDFYKSGNSKEMHNDQSTGDAVYWWERSPCPTKKSFCEADKYQGIANANSPFYSSGFAPAFCVG